MSLMLPRLLTGLLLFICGSFLLTPVPVHADPFIHEFTLGMSAQGRPITVVQIGSGERKLVVVGNTHGGPEANTHVLTEQLIAHFRANPAEVPANVRLYLIPTINPDGLALDSRFDAQGVDLNRNMNTNLDVCPENDWRTTVFGAYGLIADTGGTFPESQLESRIIRNFLLDASGAIFLHSNAGLVFPPFCDHEPSIQMAQTYAEAAGYVYSRFWDAYMITGGMHDWAGSLGIAAITPELLSATESEFEQNLAGLQTVLAQADTLLPLPEDQVENGFVVPALIWRYWRSHGGEDIFGLPLEPAQVTPEGVTQTFTNVRLELRPALADTTFLVQPTMLGREMHQEMVASDESFANIALHADTAETERYLSQTVPLTTAELYFEETGYRLIESFLWYWRIYEGADVFGYPISDEFEMRTADGQVRIVQFFERAAFAYYPEDNSVRLEPLGWQEHLLERVQDPEAYPQIR